MLVGECSVMNIKESIKPYFKLFIVCIACVLCLFLISKLDDLVKVIALSSSNISIAIINKIQSIFEIIVEGFFAIFAILLFRYVDKRPLNTFGFIFSKEARKITAYCVLILIGLFILFISLAQSLLLVQFDIFYANLIKPIAILLTLASVFIASVGEEFLFRGYIFRSLKNNSILLAYIFSTLFFALVHLYFNSSSLLYFANLLAFGILFAFVFEITESIWPSVIIHSANDFLYVILVGNLPGFSIFHFTILISYQQWMNIQEASYIGMSLAIIAFLILRTRLKYKHLNNFSKV
jgi:membrane protease YdiL (CAAX protease family)